MRTRAERGLGASTRQVVEHATALAKLELELAVIELRSKAKPLAGGIGMAVGAAILALFGLGFALATVAVALDLALPLWVSLLIVTALLFATVAVLGLAARAAFRKATPPVPEQALLEARTTSAALRRNGW
jgi:nitrate/nitrite transporter NarK